MSLALKQTVKLHQGLSLTPQVQLGIKLLALSRLELRDAIEQELGENPLLEEEEAGPEEDVDWESYRESMRLASRESKAVAKGGDSFEFSIEQTYSQKPTLSEHLLWQVQMSDLSSVGRDIAERLIGEMRENGYLDSSSCPPEMVVVGVATTLNVPVSWVETVRHRVMELDPVGCLSKNVQECLLAQLKVMGVASENIACKLVTRCFEQLKKQDFNGIIKTLGVSRQVLKDAVRVVEQLEPTPGRGFMDAHGHVGSHYVVPDVYVAQVGADYLVIPSEDGVPHLRVSSNYASAMAVKQGSPEKSYIREKMQAAHFLIRSIEQRRRTICRVAESIVTHQRGWFDGTHPLRPLVLRQLAQQLDVHESTVSRVTSNKYMHTPRGIFELKYFFGGSVQTNDGDVTNEAVKETLTHLMNGENPQKPLSDMKLMQLLKAQNIHLARRTIAKYRESLGILPSSKRKRI